MISEELGLTLENVTEEHLGSCAKVKVSKDDTILLDGDGDKAMIEDRCQIIREAAENTQSDCYYSFFRIINASLIYHFILQFFSIILFKKSILVLMNILSTV